MINIVMGMLHHNSNGGRFTSLESRITSMETTMNARFSSIENRITSLDERFHTLTGKVIEVDNRLTRVEAILERH